MGTILSFLSKCCTRITEESDDTQHDPEAQISKLSEPTSTCIFCNVTTGNGFQIAREDSEFIVFKDHNPAAAHHLLVIPRIHIANVKKLAKSDAAMVERMANLATLALDDYGVPTTSRRLGFHIPPFNSVQHLHLHAHGLPYRSFIRRWKYIVAPGAEHHDKGFSWFVDVTQAIRILERGQRITVLPC